MNAILASLRGHALGLLRAAVPQVVGDDAGDVREHGHESEPLACGQVLEGGAPVGLPALTRSVRVLGPVERLLLQLGGEAVLPEPAGAQPLERAAIAEIEVAPAQLVRKEPAEVEQELAGEQLRDGRRLRL